MEQPQSVKPTKRLVSTGVLCFALAGGFIALFSGLLGGPRSSSADPVGQGRIRLQQREKQYAGNEEFRTVHTRAAEGLPLGELTGAVYRVRITSGIDGPRYAVLSLDGSILIENATLEEAAAAFPELDLLDLSGGPDDAVIIGPLMLADPDRE